jgi:hypothetical protein
VKHTRRRLNLMVYQLWLQNYAWIKVSDSNKRPSLLSNSVNIAPMFLYQWPRGALALQKGRQSTTKLKKYKGKGKLPPRRNVTKLF